MSSSAKDFNPRCGKILSAVRSLIVGVAPDANFDTVFGDSPARPASDVAFNPWAAIKILRFLRRLSQSTSKAQHPRAVTQTPFTVFRDALNLCFYTGCLSDFIFRGCKSYYFMISGVNDDARH
ncbi:MAG: hypothetical protein QNJ16_15925 [Rhodobacter sp.]|nr:hypothetical protein [Rhodobacter sp.]